MKSALKRSSEAAGRPVTKLLVHVRPHFDEVFAVWMLKNFGKEKYPGVDKAKLSFFNPEDPDCDGRLAEDAGFLMVGIGHGRFDEHPAIGEEGKNGDCAATLVAKELGIMGEPALERLLKFATDNDLRGSGSPFDIAYIPKLLYRQYPDKPETAIQWMLLGIEAKYQEQLAFVTITKKEFDENAKVEQVRGPNAGMFPVQGSNDGMFPVQDPNARMLKMVTICSDNEQMNKYARSAAGGNAAIIIQRQSSGNTQIYTNKYYGLKLYDVISMLRLAEQEAKGQVVTTDWKKLAAEGKCLGAEEWYFHEQGQMALNGSLTAKVPPTKLSLERIQEIVRIGINPNRFEPSRTQKCSKGIGICTSTRENECPWYKFGLHRCRSIRFAMKR